MRSGRLFVIAVLAAIIASLPGLGLSSASRTYVSTLPQVVAVNNLVMAFIPAILAIGHALIATKWTLRLWAAFLASLGPVNLISVWMLNLEGRQFAASELLRFVDQSTALGRGIDTSAAGEINIAAVNALVSALIGLIHSMVHSSLRWKVATAAVMSVGVTCTYFGYWMLVPMDGPPPTFTLVQVALIGWVAPFIAGFASGHLATLLLAPAPKFANAADAHGVHAATFSYQVFLPSGAVKVVAVAQPVQWAVLVPPSSIPGAAAHANGVTDLNERLPASDDEEA